MAHGGRRLRLSKIVAFAGEDVPDTAHWIGNVARVARYYMKMQLLDCLARNRSLIDANIESLGTVLAGQFSFLQLDEFEAGQQLFR
ncbi:hypothetical protein [Mesorhizobium sp. M1A.F.Ca.ET.072.01.1.1]|uniref:hypothetical protein n=1 Tax=Mesorhizobium sp. M1A.F.Ca.ET.072.01.1.1 TaxID=2496753 RepID=UPI001FE0DA49|nr:hypothetical protein [Mesorhizobium sp. M1A.F.Ca.ET.072.01.1.1]